MYENIIAGNYMKIILYIFLAVLCITETSAQTRKSVEAYLISSSMTIDGKLNEPVYMQALPAKDFVQLQPYNGKPSVKPTEVYFFYDQTAIYVGAKLYDDPDSIFNYLTERDNTGMSDYFGVYIDPYNQGQLAFGFFITPAGVQVDVKATKSDEDIEDPNWNAVWESKTQINADGWTVEMKIPYSAIRFSKNANNSWGLNMFRNIKRHNSNNSWNFIDRKVSGFIHQEGELIGISNIKPPVRLSLSPYLATYFQPKSKDASAGFLYKGGLDLKYGLNDAFTLDMMLIPDFGQIQSDDRQLNLSPYELYYDEKRQFFTEGTELFQRGGIFYSRRIGAAPKFSASGHLNDGEVVDYNPAETQLVNATKVSGRTQNGWGIGVLNAMSLPSEATLKNAETGSTREVQVQPFTNYNVAVVDKSLKNNSYISLINTNILMAGNPFHANVTATEFQFRDKTKTYALKGKAGVSVRGNETIETGFYSTLRFEKNKGNWLYGAAENLYSDKFNPNDLGYLERNNLSNTEAWFYYQALEPKGILLEWNFGLWSNYNRIYNPNTIFDTEAGYEASARFKNNFFLYSNANVASRQNNYYEPRVKGHYYLNPVNYKFNIQLTSDTRKHLFFQGGYGYRVQPEIGSVEHAAELESYLRIGQRFVFDYSIGGNKSNNERGYVMNNAAGDSITFARRDVSTLINTLSASYIFNYKTSLTFRMRHYWSGVSNKEFFLLNDDGTLNAYPDFSQNMDQNYNAFTIDMIFRWIFAPGSELSLAWKTNSYDNHNEVIYNYQDNLIKSWLNQKNSISLKVLYYIDYNRLRKKKI